MPAVMIFQKENLYSCRKWSLGTREESAVLSPGCSTSNWVCVLSVRELVPEHGR